MKRTRGFKTNGRNGKKRSRVTVKNPRTGGFLGIEVKFYDTKLASGTLTAPTDASGGEHNPSATIALNTVVQGDGESNRDGKDITMRSIGVKGNFHVPAQVDETALDEGIIVFVALVLDKQTNGALLNSEDVFKNIGAAAIQASNPWRNLQYTKRFQVLKSLTITLPQAQPAYDGTNLEQAGYTIPFEMFHKFKNGLGVHYTGTTESIANIMDNSLTLIAWANATAMAPVINYSARLRFVG